MKEKLCFVAYSKEYSFKAKVFGDPRAVLGRVGMRVLKCCGADR